ncbi:MAG: (Fe-S)-binding protein [Alphaproteobacteria bacterium]
MIEAIHIDGKPLSNLKIGVFITCLVDMFRPEIGFACLKLLEDAGCKLIIAPRLSCCGQPAYNAGDIPSAQKVAAKAVAALADFDRIIVPSGSCAGMLSHHYPNLFEAGHPLHADAQKIASKTRELSQFLYDECQFQPADTSIKGVAAYHDSCSSLREMKVDHQPRVLLQSQARLNVANIERRESCCGFGGMFCVKYPEISNKMVEDKTDAIKAIAPDYLLAGDLGCILNIAGKLSRQNSDIKAYHYAELLAFGDETPAIYDAKITN